MILMETLLKNENLIQSVERNIKMWVIALVEKLKRVKDIDLFTKTKLKI